MNVYITPLHPTTREGDPDERIIMRNGEITTRAAWLQLVDGLAMILASLDPPIPPPPVARAPGGRPDTSSTERKGGTWRTKPAPPPPGPRLPNPGTYEERDPR